MGTFSKLHIAAVSMLLTCAACEQDANTGASGSDSDFVTSGSEFEAAATNGKSITLIENVVMTGTGRIRANSEAYRVDNLSYR